MLSEVEIETVRIPIDDFHSIFCLVSGDPDNPPLVMLHGWLGASMMFFKILKYLTVNYRVYCLDLLGMGRSSRPVFTAKTYEESEAFFVIPIEKCRIHLGIEKMILVGHSFGGYIAGCYYEAYPDRVDKLVMLSPAGINKPNENFDIEIWLQEKPFFARVFLKIARFFWARDVTPTVLLRKIGPFGGRFVKRYLKRRIVGLSKPEIKNLKVYFQQVNLYPGSGEFALSRIIKELLYAHAPLCDRLTDVPIVFLYGEKDWMDHEGAVQNKAVNKVSVIIDFVSNAGHQLYIDNPQETAEKMIAGLKKLDELN